MPADRTPKVPTEKQYRKLAAIGTTYMAVAPRRSEWAPLVRRGWVELISEDDQDKRFLPPLRVTPAGLRAVAAYLDRHPAPVPSGLPKQVDDPPDVTRLKEKLSAVTAERDAARRDRSAFEMKLRRVARVIGDDGPPLFSRREEINHG